MPEEIDINDEEEEALERAWDKLDNEDKDSDEEEA